MIATGTDMMIVTTMLRTPNAEMMRGIVTIRLAIAFRAVLLSER
jgi:hypothetical protein